ncbi:MAG: hypothetical protein IT379_08625 [Deltaproteobacteria bacterium]|nr:hypothetical protein [Deltaproteobacteria bacterium]
MERRTGVAVALAVWLCGAPSLAQTTAFDAGTATTTDAGAQSAEAAAAAEARRVAEEAERARRAPLAVEIESPTGGPLDVGAALTASFEARVSDPAIRTALLSVNGAVYEVPVDDARVRQQVVVVPGNNRIGIVVRRGRETARASITFFAQSDPADLIVLLTWPAHGEIVDLWVREPSGETCKWDHRTTATGGRLLDFSQDAIGFGSQAFVAPSVSAGRYRIKVHYWGGYDEDDARARYTYEELIGRLDQLEERIRQAPNAGERAPAVRERAEIERQLDRWSSPGAPQTPVHAEAILFPGTRHERRWRFDLVIQRTGQLLALGEVEVTDAMIRAARSRGE